MVSIPEPPIYAEHNVGHAWLIDPLAQMLEAYRLQAGRWLQLGTWRGAAKVRAEPFEAVEFALSAIWEP